MKASETKTVVFVTGAFVSPFCWDDWKKYIESKGYTTYADKLLFLSPRIW